MNVYDSGLLVAPVDNKKPGVLDTLNSANIPSPVDCPT
jgi:hypothetical protein